MNKKEDQCLFQVNQKTTFMQREGKLKSPHYKASDVTDYVPINPKFLALYYNYMIYYGRAAKRKPLSINIQQRNKREIEMMNKHWNWCTLSFARFRNSGRLLPS